MSKEALFGALKSAIDGAGRREYFDRLVAAVQSLIANHILQPGDLLPAERELSTTLDVSRAVIRRVISQLESDGILSTRHGHGTFVPRELRKSTNSILGFTEEMHRRGIEVRNEIVRFARRFPTHAEVIEFGFGPDSEIIELRRVRHADDLAVAHELSLAPSWSFSPAFDGSGSLYGEMEKAGTRPVRVLQEIGAAAAESEIAASLGVPEGFPVLRITRKGYDRSNSVVEFTVSQFRSDRYTWITELQK